jgi:hypothetical protein
MPSWMLGAGFQRLASKYANTLENEMVKKPHEIARQKLVRPVIDITYALH